MRFFLISFYLLHSIFFLNHCDQGIALHSMKFFNCYKKIVEQINVMAGVGIFMYFVLFTLVAIVIFQLSSVLKAKKIFSGR